MAKVDEQEVDVAELRRKLQLTQKEFWGQIGVTQSGGSRYENNRRIPAPISLLLEVTYLKGLNLDTVAKGDAEILAYLKANPSVLKAVKADAKVFLKSQSRA